MFKLFNVNVTIIIVNNDKQIPDEKKIGNPRNKLQPEHNLQRKQNEERGKICLTKKKD